ncbi:MAG: TrmH family RNA methyltransferase [Bacteroidetes bacterium]|nr:MAG: TrmH family RNA methyltransferase [Bacteroidota bacterium]
MTEELISYLSKVITPERFSLFNKIIKDRTRYMTVVLEDIFQPHNASAVLRSCDCFGVQDVHIIENENEYKVNPDVALGSSKWLNLYKYNEAENNTLSTINALKKKGYRIIATTPHNDDVNLEDFDISKGKFALMFGSEQPGLSNIAMENADEFLKIPMFGFTESFNISVSAAVILHHLSLKLRQSDIKFKLSEDEQNTIILEWLKQSIKKSDLIIEKFLTKKIK